MNEQLVNVQLHGILAEQVGREDWNISVSSVGEALRAIESQTKKLFKNLIKNDKENIRYRVLINKKDFLYDQEKDINTREGINSSELIRDYKNLKSIDIVPIVEGADFKDIFAIVTGIVLIALGVFTFGATSFLGASLIMSGVGLMAAGIANLLTPMPEFGDFREIEGGGRRSYLFSGPENTVREGGPVFIGYGRLMVGSQVVQSSIETFDVRSGLRKNEGKLTREDYWGNERYGLEYRDRVQNSSGTVQNMMRKRVEEWNKASFESDECGSDFQIVKDPVVVITTDAGELVTERRSRD
mgnify:FL=1|jgi:predicted phage tail protein|tara:strand:- start:3024 stop:3920 length:897 start_codon:yes stop_codon:yes gene_type:complete